MQRLLTIFIFCFSFSVASSGATYAANVLVIGDSISAAYGMDESDGWVALAQQALKSDHPEINMINASISGDTTEGALRRLPTALERFQPDILIIEVGGNDGLRGYPLKKISENLEKLANLGRDANAQVLLLGMRIPSNYGPAYTEKFAQTFIDAATASESELVPFFLEPIAFDNTKFQPDGIHPSVEAQPLLLEVVLEKLIPMLDAATVAQ